MRLTALRTRFEFHADPVRMGPFVGEDHAYVTDDAIAAFLLDFDGHSLDELVSSRKIG